MAKARYLQLADTLEAAIKRGKLAPGSKLPTHRAFAERFGVALATATRTYGELERRGAVVGEAGRGTFVRDKGVPLSLGLQQSAADGSVDLVFNMPSDTSDADTLRSALKRLATSGDLSAMLRYQPHGGRDHERAIIANDVQRTLGPIDPAQLLITSGGQHGLSLLGFGLLTHGDAVATDVLTYPGFKSVASLQGLDLVPIASSKGIMDPEALERSCQSKRIKGVYLMPTVHNPLGTVMDLATRLRIVDVARRHDLMIFEDAAYAFLEPDPPTGFLTLAPERTVHIGGFSKTLATGLRLGYLIAPLPQIEPLTEAIRATTWNAPALISDLVTNWILDGTSAQFEANRREDGAERQNICADILRDHRLLSHRNASFAWLPLEQGVRAEPIVISLKKLGVSVSDARPFAVGSTIPQALRIAFGGVPKHEFQTALEAVRTAIDAASPS